jgi:hypothetical protein
LTQVYPEEITWSHRHSEKGGLLPESSLRVARSGVRPISLEPTQPAEERRLEMLGIIPRDQLAGAGRFSFVAIPRRCKSRPSPVQEFHASGEIMDAAKMTAAHRTLPFGTQVTVVNRGNGRAVMVRINDRGPFVHGRVIDLSPAAGRALNIDGLASVSLIMGDADASHANEHLSEPVAPEEGLNGP